MEVLCKIGYKKKKIILCTPVSKFQEISTLNICDGAKQICTKKQQKKKDSKTRYSLNLSSSQPKGWYKKGVLYI